MAAISITEQTFALISLAAYRAYRAGDMDDAKDLDKIARQMNLALSGNNPSARYGKAWGIHPPERTWRDIPSTLPEDLWAAKSAIV